MEKIGENANIKKIAVTGAISSGKSTLSDLLAKRGAYVIKADELVHELLSSDTLTIQQIKTIFGDVLTNGVIDRKKLAALVFPAQDRLKTLEAILHPKVIEAIKKCYEEVQHLPFKAFIVEFPLLFESGFTSWFDTILYVTASPTTRKNRFISKGFKEEEFAERSAHFLPETEKMALADKVIHNDGSLLDLEKTADQIV